MALVQADYPGVHTLSDNLGGPERQGTLMRSPLSQKTCNFDLGTIRSYVDGCCESLDGAGCREFIKVFRGLNVTSILLPTLVSESKHSNSYDWLQEYLQRPDCEWVFCRQLSDQLVILRRVRRATHTSQRTQRRRCNATTSESSSR